MAQTLSDHQAIMKLWQKDPNALRLNLATGMAYNPIRASKPLRPKNALQYAKAQRRGKKPSYRQRQASGRAARRKGSMVTAP